MSHHTISLDCLKVHYEKFGKKDGLPIILMHGWGGNTESFQDLKKYFPKSYQLFILDLPGFGKSSMPFEVWDVSHYANFIFDFAEIQGFSQFGVLGHSFGGRIAIKMAVAQPQKIAFLILCASAGIMPQKGLKHKLLYGLSKIGALVFQLPVLNRSTGFAKKVLYKLARVKDYNQTSGVMREIFIKVINEDLEPLLSKINLPTLLIWGKDDKITPLADARIMHQKIAGSQLKIIEQARHGVHFQQPQKTGEAIGKFLKK